MLDVLFDSFRKASESSLQIQQDLMKHWAQQWQAVPMSATASSSEWNRSAQQRWFRATLDLLNKHRESLDSAYRSGIQLVEQTLRISDAKSPEDYRRVTEDLWRKLFETLKGQSESQLRDFRELTEKAFAAVQRNNSPS